MKKTRKSRESWIDAGLKRLAERGVEGVRVEPLAKQLGVTKGSFYWHFENRQALLEAMVAYWEETQTSAVIAVADAAGPDPAIRLERLRQVTTSMYLSDLELKLRAWGQRDLAVGSHVAKVDERRVGYLRELLVGHGLDPVAVEAGVLILYSVLIANPLLPFEHPGLTREQVLDEAIRMVTRS